jgi:hypothetical protein
MQASERDALKARHDFQVWAGRSAGPAEGVLRNVTFTGTEVPGFRLERADRRDTAQPPRLSTFWRRGESPAVVRIDLFENASREAAHEYLIDALNEFESAGITRRPELNVGTVAFGTASVVLFARGNLVVLVRKATPQSEPVTGVAQVIDTMFVARLRAG